MDNEKKQVTYNSSITGETQVTFDIQQYMNNRAMFIGLRFVTNTASGMGLIKCGSVVIPFDNQISKDTDLYRLYNTNIHEKIAEQKKKK